MLLPSIAFPHVIHSHQRQLFQNLRGLSPLCDLCAMLLPSIAFPHVIHFTSARQLFQNLRGLSLLFDLSSPIKKF
jgi:hypothetical protein